jgi:hypothetical protein
MKELSAYKEKRRARLARSLTLSNMQRETPIRRSMSRAFNDFYIRRAKVVACKCVLTLSHEHLVHVQENVAALHDHPLHCQVFAQVLRLAHLKPDCKRREFSVGPILCLQKIPRRAFAARGPPVVCVRSPGSCVPRGRAACAPAARAG